VLLISGTLLLLFPIIAISTITRNNTITLTNATTNALTLTNNVTNAMVEVVEAFKLVT
jgi:Na+-translocating ferredoxin:NAD+ oxidoreductase RnfE subunit